MSANRVPLTLVKNTGRLIVQGTRTIGSSKVNRKRLGTQPAIVNKNINLGTTNAMRIDRALKVVMSYAPCTA